MRKSICGTCYEYYERGTYAAHKKSGAHVAELKQRRAMAEWYRRNGS